MGGWNYKGKREADSLLNIRTKALREKGFFKNSLTGVLSWTNSWTGNTNTVGLKTEINGETGYMRIYYSQTPEDGERKDFDYKVPLTSTPCPYGGRRNWFICPLSVNGIHCGRRTNVLYKNGEYFGCRICHKLTYSRQNYGGRYKGFISVPDIEKAEEKVKRRYYRGKPTRQYRKVLKLNERFELGFIEMVARLKKVL